MEASNKNLSTHHFTLLAASTRVKGDLPPSPHIGFRAVYGLHIWRGNDKF